MEEDSEAVREERPVAPSVRAIFGDSRATPVVLTFLRDTRVRRVACLAPREEGWPGEEEESESESEGEEGRLGAP